jgi:hypothetical protein
MVHHAVPHSPSRLRNMGMWGPVLGVIPAVSEEGERASRIELKENLAITLRSYLRSCPSVG